MLKRVHRLAVILTFMAIAVLNVTSVPCAPRKYESNSFVCVCNATYCDTLPRVNRIDTIDGKVLIYETSKSKSRFAKYSTMVKPNTVVSDVTGAVIIEIQTYNRYQKIIGFGGAFTDSAGINIAKLSLPLRDTLVRNYYSADGSEYNMGRVPMASTDFSTRIYSYDDTPYDFELTNFNLAMEDLKYKIPYITMAKTYCATDRLLLFATPWASPYWMKTNNNMTGAGTLKPENIYYQTFANYFVKFLRSYEERGLQFWGLTMENEPSNGFREAFPFQAMGFTKETSKIFLNQFLGPTIAKSKYRPNIMLNDDQRTYLPEYVEPTLDSELGQKYSAGIAFHWYLNNESDPRVLDDLMDKYPNKFILSTEAANGVFSPNPVILGNWDRGEQYAYDIITDLQHSSSGWVDWNLVLDEQGGPNIVKNFVDSAIIINATANEYYKQPMYYIIAHFSKLLPRGSVRIKSVSSVTDSDLEAVAFQRPDNGIVVHILNRKNDPVSVNLRLESNEYIDYIVPPSTLQSYVWWPNRQPVYG